MDELEAVEAEVAEVVSGFTPGEEGPDASPEVDAKRAKPAASCVVFSVAVLAEEDLMPIDGNS